MCNQQINNTNHRDEIQIQEIHDQIFPYVRHSNADKIRPLLTYRRRILLFFSLNNYFS